MSYRVGAVAYHPRVVTIWEDFRRWFAEHGLPLEYTLYATYEAQVDALVAGQIDLAWNTNLAYVQACERSGDACSVLAMRDTDRDWTSLALAPAGSVSSLEELRGKRVGFGDSDSPQAWILPAFAMRRQGVDPGRDLRAERLDFDVGKHGDTGRAELAQVERLRAGELDACVVSNWTLKALRDEGADDGLAVAWNSPPFHHCNFTRLDSSTASHDAFRALLVSMDAADPALCEAMRLENVNRWVEGDESGYADLVEAVRWRDS
jgi:ABC-type phosphate/phosphonate transport system substrate-binding protein